MPAVCACAARFRRSSECLHGKRIKNRDTEILTHLALLEDDFRRGGLSLQEAREAARRAYGGVEESKQLHREERTFQELVQMAQDIRCRLRQLLKSWSENK